MLFAAVEDFCKSIENWQSNSHGYGGNRFFLTHSVESSRYRAALFCCV